MNMNTTLFSLHSFSDHSCLLVLLLDEESCPEIQESKHSNDIEYSTEGEIIMKYFQEREIIDWK